MPRFNLTEKDKILAEFLEYLEEFSISPKSLRNYKSDVSHFTGWLIFKTRTYGVLANTLADTFPFITMRLVLEYKNFLIENDEPAKTINRRLSTLRHLARFFLASRIFDSDFMQGVSNINIPKEIKQSHLPLLVKFQKQLESENVSKGTIKNYISDVNQFFVWLEERQVSSN